MVLRILCDSQVRLVLPKTPAGIPEVATCFSEFLPFLNSTALRIESVAKSVRNWRETQYSLICLQFSFGTVFAETLNFLRCHCVCKVIA